RRVEHSEGSMSDETARRAGANAPTQIRFVQTGGVGGVKLVADVDGSRLTPSETAALERLVDAALAKRPSAPTASRVRDDLQYDVQVTRGGVTTSLRAHEADVTPGL